MKKILTLILLLCMILTLAACGKVEITMQEIYDASKTEALLKNHESVSIREEMDGELLSERYLTKEYIYEHFPDEEFDYAEFMIDDALYCYADSDYLHYLSVTPDGLSDFKGLYANHYASAVLSEDIATDTIEAVSKKDGRITVNSVLAQDAMAVFGVSSGKFEYVLDANSREIISLTSDYAFSDGTAFGTVAKVSYDKEAPEMVETFLEYANQTENLRNITVVSNPGTEQEVSQSIQSPKGLIIGLRYNEDSAYEFEVYTNAACTDAYDPYADTDSDMTIYIKWTV